MPLSQDNVSDFDESADVARHLVVRPLSPLLRWWETNKESRKGGVALEMK